MNTIMEVNQQRRKSCIIKTAVDPVTVCDVDLNNKRPKAKELFHFHSSSMRDTIQVQRRHNTVLDDEKHEAVDSAELREHLVLDHSGHIGATDRSVRPKNVSDLAAEHAATTAGDAQGSARGSRGRPGWDREEYLPALNRPSHTVLNLPDCTTRRPCDITESRRHISFGSVTVREYAMVLGDHPDCSYGPPVTLGWDYLEFKPLPVDEYEIHHALRRPLIQLCLNYYMRMKFLLLDYSEQEIKEATRKKSFTKFKRNITRQFLPYWKVEDGVTSAGRKLKRLVVKEKSDEELYAWTENANDATGSTGSTYRAIEEDR